MTREILRKMALEQKHVIIDIKWGHDLCFNIGQKMFLVLNLQGEPTTATFKVKEIEIASYLDSSFIQPAKYLARFNWLTCYDISKIQIKTWEKIIADSYDLVFENLSKKTKATLIY